MPELPPYTGPIGTGDQFIWAPPGYDFPPAAFAHIEITDIVFNGEENIIYFCRHNGLGDCYDGPDNWWEESSFRLMVILHQRAKPINDYEPHKYTTDNPRIP